MDTQYGLWLEAEAGPGQRLLIARCFSSED